MSWGLRQRIVDLEKLVQRLREFCDGVAKDPDDDYAAHFLAEDVVRIIDDEMEAMKE